MPSVNHITAIPHPLRLRTLLSSSTTTSTPISSRSFSAHPLNPAWSGKKTTDNVIHRKTSSPHDPQAKASAAAHAEREAREKEGKDAGALNGGTGSGGKEGSQATSQSDHGGSNKKAEKEFPEAPGPVIGMNDERGQKGH